MLINIIIQARTSSRRFNSKVLQNIFKQNSILYLVERLKNLKHVNKVIVATSTENSDNKLSNILKKKKVFVFRGPLKDVYSRYRTCLILYKCDYFVRISGDSPFLSIKLLQSFINIIKKNNKIDILSNIINKTFPKGQSIEICNSKKFISLKCDIKEYLEREHVTKVFYNNANKFKFINIFQNNYLNIDNLNCCIDYPRDIFLCKKFVNDMKIKKLHKNYSILKS